MFNVPQESSTEALKSFENDLKMKSVDIHKTVEKQIKKYIFQAPKANREFRFPLKRLLASDLEVLEVSGTPRSDQESLKEVFKSSKVTIHGVCQVIMSPQGAVGSPQRAPKELLESQNQGQSSPEELHRVFRELRKRS